jgi:heptosyltransferase-2
MKLPDPLSIKTIVVRCPNWLGDAVMATPIFQDIAEIFPHARVTALAHHPVCELLQGLDGIDEFLPFSRAEDKKSEEEKRIIRTLRDKGVDLGILLTRSFSSALMFWRANVTWRLGFVDHFRRCLLNIPITLPSSDEHEVHTYRRLLHPFKEISTNPYLCLHVTQEEQNRVRTLFGIPAEAPLLIVNPGAAYGSAKCWPKEYFREVIAALHNSMMVVCIGDAKTKPLIDEIVSGLSPNVVNLAGRTSIRELLALISTSNLVLTNDSGPMHMACGLKKKLVALFGSTSPIKTGPFEQGIVMQAKASCAPCYRRECPTDFRCMRQIVPSDVIAQLKGLL